MNFARAISQKKFNRRRLSGSCLPMIPHHPFPMPPDEEEFLRNIFPVEVWEIILVKHMSVNSNILCRNTSKFFSVVLERKRVEWLFEAVYPFIGHELAYSTALKLRLVCKKWKDGIDKYLEELPQILGLKTRTTHWSPYLNRDSLCPHFYIKFDTSIKINSFINQVESQSERIGSGKCANYNPFPGRCVLFEPSPEERRTTQQRQEFWGKTRLLFSKLGIFIYSVQIFWEGSPEELYKVLFEIVYNSNKLRFIKLGGFVTGHEVLNQNYLNGLRKEMTDWPLVALNDLEYLYVDTINLPRPLLKMLLVMYSQNLRYLSIENHEPCTTYLRGMASLSELQLTKAFCSTITQEIRAIYPAHFLKSVCLFLKPDYPLSFFDPESLLESLSRFENLKSLEIYFSDVFRSDQPTVKQVPQGAIQKLQLKNLKWFGMSTYPAMNYDFIMCFPNVESVHISMSSKYWPEFPNIPPFANSSNGSDPIEMNRFLFSKSNGGMSQSNLWKLLPALNRFSFKLHSFHNDSVMFSQVLSRQAIKLE